MYRLFLAVRYLLTRPINLLGMTGITISVWALVVVVSLFSGFLQVIEQHVRSATSDVVVSDVPAWTPWPTLQAAIADDPYVLFLHTELVKSGLVTKTHLGWLQSMYEVQQVSGGES